MSSPLGVASSYAHNTDCTSGACDSAPAAANGSPLKVCLGRAIVSNWDGQIEVDNSSVTTAALCCASGPLNAQSYNRYGTMKNASLHDLAAPPASSERADIPDDIQGNRNATSSTSTPEYQRRQRRRRRSQSEKSLHNLQPSNADNYRGSPQRCGASLGGGGGDPATRHSYSRLGPFSRHTTISSSILGDSMTEIRIEDLPNEHEPTSAILDYCKRKFLRPYLTILSLVGLNPMSTDVTLCRAGLSYAQAIFVLLLLIFGYFFQYICSYRGDRGFANYHIIFPSGTSPFRNNGAGYSVGSTEVHTIGELLFGYVIPNALHLCGFISAIIVCKIVGQEQLQNLVERVFLMSMKPRQLCRTLWLYVTGGFFMLGILVAYVTPSVLMQTRIVQANWLTGADFALNDWQFLLKAVLLITLSLQDLVEIIILSSYCIECYLLRVHLATLSHKLLMHSIESLDWMREVLEFRKLLDHLNQRVAVPVCFFIIMNLAYAFAGFVYLFKDFDFHYSALKVVVLNIINVLLWLLMGLVPFFMAASVTRVCQTAQANGHQIRVRPFVYHNTSTDDLNSTLLFASSLNMSAKLFRMPIQPNYVCFAIVIVSIVVLTLGMCLNLSALGNF